MGKPLDWKFRTRLKNFQSYFTHITAKAKQELKNLDCWYIIDIGWKLQRSLVRVFAYKNEVSFFLRQNCYGFTICLKFLLFILLKMKRVQELFQICFARFSFTTKYGESVFIINNQFYISSSFNIASIWNRSFMWYFVHDWEML